MSDGRRRWGVGARPEAKVVRALAELGEIEAPLTPHMAAARDELRHYLDELDPKAIADLAWYFGAAKLAAARGEA